MDKLNKKEGISSDKDFEKLKKILSSLEIKYKKTKKEILNLIEEMETMPVSIFNNTKLSIPESIVKYFVEEKNYKYSKISKIIKRDQRTVWGFYNKARKKFPKKLKINDSKLIPVSIFSKKSLLETIAIYLKKNFDLSYHDVAVLLNRDDRTIWTVCNRKKK